MLLMIAANAQGRPQITEEEARFHTQLQASVAITYGMQLGTAIHFFDSAVPSEQLATQIVFRLSRP
jgi:adenylate kinase